jgi:putative transposase
MSRTVSPSAGRRYGLALVCRVWDINRSTIYATRHRLSAPSAEPTKRGPKTQVSDTQLLELIKDTIEKSAWLGEGYRKVWAQLKAKAVFVCKRRVNRLMREANLLSPSRSFKLAVVQGHDGRITTDRPDEMWGTDGTGTDTAEGHASIFILVDHCTTECLGIHAARKGNRYEALEPIRQGVSIVFGHYDEKIAVGLKVRHDTAASS